LAVHERAETFLSSFDTARRTPSDTIPDSSFEPSVSNEPTAWRGGAGKLDCCASNMTTRESDRGKIILEDGYITIKFQGRATQKYQFIAFMTQPNGAAILSLVPVHDTFQGYFGERMILQCGHSRGYISCVSGEEWARLGARPAR